MCYNWVGGRNSFRWRAPRSGKPAATSTTHKWCRHVYGTVFQIKKKKKSIFVKFAGCMPCGKVGSLVRIYCAPSIASSGRVAYLVRCPPQSLKKMGSNPIARGFFRPISGDIFIDTAQHGSNILSHTSTVNLLFLNLLILASISGGKYLLYVTHKPKGCTKNFEN